jgi:hypothetical protein
LGAPKLADRGFHRQRGGGPTRSPGARANRGNRPTSGRWVGRPPRKGATRRRATPRWLVLLPRRLSTPEATGNQEGRPDDQRLPPAAGRAGPPLSSEQVRRLDSRAPRCRAFDPPAERDEAVLRKLLPRTPIVDLIVQRDLTHNAMSRTGPTCSTR